MISKLNLRKLAMVALIGATAGGLGACDPETILSVERPGILEPVDLAGPTSAPLALAGVYGDFTEAFDNYVRYSGMFTDEFILAGTFPTRNEVDDRNITPDNATVTDELYEPLHTARFSADTLALFFQENLGDEDYNQDVLLEGIAAGYYLGGYTRMIMSELYCEVPVGGGEFLLSADRMAEAIDYYQNAQTWADSAGLTNLLDAAYTGEARAHMFLGDYDAAEAVLANVSGTDEFFLAEYSANSNQQYNEVYTLTWGVTQSIRWTVGGHTGTRSGETWAYFDDWVDLGRIDDTTDQTAFPAFNTSITTNLQLEYDAPEEDIVASSRAEADLMLAEIALRENRENDANALVNPYRADWGLAPIDFNNVDSTYVDSVVVERLKFYGIWDTLDKTAGSLDMQLIQMAEEYARELWLQGHRQWVLRRLLGYDGINLYPAQATGGVLEGEQVCWPTPQQEVDANENESLDPDPTSPGIG